jgi:hypothetical protein
MERHRRSSSVCRAGQPFAMQWMPASQKIGEARREVAYVCEAYLDRRWHNSLAIAALATLCTLYRSLASLCRQHLCTPPIRALAGCSTPPPPPPTHGLSTEIGGSGPDAADARHNRCAGTVAAQSLSIGRCARRPQSLRPTRQRHLRLCYLQALHCLPTPPLDSTNSANSTPPQIRSVGSLHPNTRPKRVQTYESTEIYAGQCMTPAEQQLHGFAAATHR